MRVFNTRWSDSIARGILRQWGRTHYMKACSLFSNTRLFLDILQLWKDVNDFFFKKKKKGKKKMKDVKEDHPEMHPFISQIMDTCCRVQSLILDIIGMSNGKVELLHCFTFILKNCMGVKRDGGDYFCENLFSYRNNSQMSV